MQTYTKTFRTRAILSRRIRFSSSEASTESNGDVSNVRSHCSDAEDIGGRLPSSPSLSPNSNLESDVSPDPLATSASLMPKRAPYTHISPSVMPSVVGVLAGPEAGGSPPIAAVYPASGAQTSSPPSPQDLWTRAFTLAAKDAGRITTKMLLYFFERSKASYQPWTPGSSISDNSLPVLHHPIRLNRSHYTTLLHGLLLRQHYSVALPWVRRLIYPFPSPSLLKSKNPRDSLALALDGRALSVSLVVLARLGRVNEAVTVLESYAASPTTATQTIRRERHVQMNTIQMNDFLLCLLRWPSKKHALPVPSAQFPLKVASKGSKKFKLTGNDLAVSYRPTRSARPDLLLRLLPALYPRYGVSWDARTVCLMLQAVRMSAKMDRVSAFGLRSVLGEIFGKRKPMGWKKSRSLHATQLEEKMDRQQWIVESIMEVLWDREPVDAGKATDRAKSKSSKSIIKQPRIKRVTKSKPGLRHPLEYTPFTVWPWPFPHSPPPLHISDTSGAATKTSTFKSHPSSVSKDNVDIDHDSACIFGGHPFLLAREIFLRLVWAHTENLNAEATFTHGKRTKTHSSHVIDLHALAYHPPAILPPQALARLVDPDGDELGHLNGFPRWFGVLEGMLKRRLGLGIELGVHSSSSEEKGRTRADVVDAMFGYKNQSLSSSPSSITLPRLTPIAFHQYILLLGLGAPEPWDFVQSGWNIYQHPFDGYASSDDTSDLNPGAAKISTRNTIPIIPGASEIPLTLLYMRALRLIPTQDTICAAVVFWKEAVGGESLLQLGVNHFGLKSKLDRLRVGKRSKEDQGGEREAEGEEESESTELDAYETEYEHWKKSKLQGESNSGSGAGEYGKFCRWIREWVDEINADAGSRGSRMRKEGSSELKLAMPHPYHIHRWTGIIRKMREGQGYQESQDGGKDGEVEENEHSEDSYT